MPPKEKEKKIKISEPARTEELYVNREISWLAFNQRVLLEAADPKVPLLERLKFLMIYQSNLDEFYRVRIGILTHRVLLMPDSRETPEFILFLGSYLPPAMIAMLVVYCLREMDFTSAGHGVPEILSVISVMILQKWKPVFAWLPVESMIHERQEAYYQALSAADSQGVPVLPGQLS